MHPFRPPFGVPARPTNPNTTQPQNPYNLQDMDPSFLTYAAYLSGATPFVPPTFGYGQAAGLNRHNPNPNPMSKSCRRRNPNRCKKHRNAAKGRIRRRKKTHHGVQKISLNGQRKKNSPNFQTGPVFWDRVRALFFSTWGQGEHRDQDSISSKWTDINNKCHAFQEVFQHNYDNRPSGEGDVGVLTKTLEEFERTKCPFTYYKCWELLRKSPKWAVVNPMTSSSRRWAKRSKTSSSDDPSTPTSDARNVDLNEAVDVDEGIQEELVRPTGRRKGTGKKTVESSSDLELKEDFEEMNRRLQDIRDLGHQRYEIMKERVAETKKFNEMQEARQMEKDIEFLSKPIDHLQGDALILAQMRRQKIREKYGL
ncbi:putative No apical meristem-associated domain-containing protein [Helianthus annuus]|nr:putative No apical meristem-associated domain-containing protein [Helianthus annuus]